MSGNLVFALNAGASKVPAKCDGSDNFNDSDAIRIHHDAALRFVAHSHVQIDR
jgi:hypothetical protein